MTIEDFMRKFIPQMEKKNIVVLTGAGISTPSGIKDFRGKSGIYKDDEDGISILTSGYLESNPEDFYRFYRKYILVNEDYKPNLAHEVLADLENDGYIRRLYTQNIDGLHKMAGSKKVVELHGGTNFYCTNCKTNYTYDEVRKMDYVPYCKKCGSLIRPDIVLYSENYDPKKLALAEDDFSYATTLLIIGTGLEIGMIYNLAHIFIQRMHSHDGKNKKLFLINMGATSIDGFKNDVIKYDGDVMDFARCLKKYREKNE